MGSLDGVLASLRASQSVPHGHYLYKLGHESVVNPKSSVMGGGDVMDIFLDYSWEREGTERADWQSAEQHMLKSKHSSKDFSSGGSADISREISQSALKKLEGQKSTETSENSSFASGKTTPDCSEEEPSTVFSAKSSRSDENDDRRKKKAPGEEEEEEEEEQDFGGSDPLSFANTDSKETNTSSDGEHYKFLRTCNGSYISGTLHYIETPSQRACSQCRSLSKMRIPAERCRHIVSSITRKGVKILAGKTGKIRAYVMKGIDRNHVIAVFNTAQDAIDASKENYGLLPMKEHLIVKYSCHVHRFEVESVEREDTVIVPIKKRKKAGRHPKNALLAERNAKDDSLLRRTYSEQDLRVLAKAHGFTRTGLNSESTVYLEGTPRVAALEWNRDHHAIDVDISPQDVLSVDTIKMPIVDDQRVHPEAELFMSPENTHTHFDPTRAAGTSALSHSQDPSALGSDYHWKQVGSRGILPNYTGPMQPRNSELVQPPDFAEMPGLRDLQRIPMFNDDLEIGGDSESFKFMNLPSRNNLVDIPLDDAGCREQSPDPGNDIIYEKLSSRNIFKEQESKPASLCEREWNDEVRSTLSLVASHFGNADGKNSALLSRIRRLLEAAEETEKELNDGTEVKTPQAQNQAPNYPPMHPAQPSHPILNRSQGGMDLYGMNRGNWFPSDMDQFNHAGMRPMQHMPPVASPYHNYMSRMNQNWGASVQMSHDMLQICPTSWVRGDPLPCIITISAKCAVFSEAPIVNWIFAGYPSKIPGQIMGTRGPMCCDMVAPVPPRQVLEASMQQNSSGVVATIEILIPYLNLSWNLHFLYHLRERAPYGYGGGAGWNGHQGGAGDGGNNRKRDRPDDDNDRTGGDGGNPGSKKRVARDGGGNYFDFLTNNMLLTTCYFDFVRSIVGQRLGAKFFGCETGFVFASDRCNDISSVLLRVCSFLPPPEGHQARLFLEESPAVVLWATRIKYSQLSKLTKQDEDFTSSDGSQNQFNRSSSDSGDDDNDDDDDDDTGNFFTSSGYVSYTSKSFSFRQGRGQQSKVSNVHSSRRLQVEVSKSKASRTEGSVQHVKTAEEAPSNLSQIIISLSVLTLLCTMFSLASVADTSQWYSGIIGGISFFLLTFSTLTLCNRMLAEKYSNRNWRVFFFMSIPLALGGYFANDSSHELAQYGITAVVHIWAVMVCFLVIPMVYNTLGKTYDKLFMWLAALPTTILLVNTSKVSVGLHHPDHVISIILFHTRTCIRHTATYSVNTTACRVSALSEFSMS